MKSTIIVTADRLVPIDRINHKDRNVDGEYIIDATYQSNQDPFEVAIDTLRSKVKIADPRNYDFFCRFLDNDPITPEMRRIR